jgi:hypothetical protein
MFNGSFYTSIKVKNAGRKKETEEMKQEEIIRNNNEINKTSE